MRCTYRDDPMASQSISKLPVAVRTPADKLKRLETISKQWAESPNKPRTHKTFVAGEQDKESLDELATDLRPKIKALSPRDLQFKAAALNLRAEANANSVAAAPKQGRGQFSEGTAERKLIDAIAAPVSVAKEPEAATGATGGWQVLLRREILATDRLQRRRR